MKKVFHITKLFGLCAGLYIALMAMAAWAQPLISVHPLVTEKTKRGERWHTFFMQELAKQNIILTPEPVVQSFLEERGGSCNNNDPCLYDLGQSTKAHYVLLANLYRSESTYVVSARLVRADGIMLKNIGPLSQPRVSNVIEDKNADAIFSKLFAELRLEDLDPHPPDVFKEKEIIIDTVLEDWVDVWGWGRMRHEELELRLRTQTSPMRVTSYSLLGTAVVAGLAGGAFGFIAHKNYTTYKERFPGAGVGDTTQITNGSASVEEALKYTNRTRNYKIASIAVSSVAGAAAIGGIISFFLSPERYVKSNASQKKTEETPKAAIGIGIFPTQGGAMLSLQGVFP